MQKEEDKKQKTGQQKKNISEEEIYDRKWTVEHEKETGVNRKRQFVVRK